MVRRLIFLTFPAFFSPIRELNAISTATIKLICVVI